MKLWINYMLSIIAMFVFAYISSYAPPEYTSYVFLGYFIFIMAIMAIISGRGFKKTSMSIRDVLSGKIIVKADDDDVKPLMSKDPLLNVDLKAQGLTMLTMFTLPLLVLILFYLLNSFRFQSIIASRVSELGYCDEHFGRFLGWLILYALLFSISSLNQIVNRISASKRGYAALMIAKRYKVTDKGIVINDMTVLPAPIEAKSISYDEKRKFVDIIASIASNPIGATKLRLYSKKPKDLYNIILKLTK
ncbi:MAG: DUF2208 family protein [Candidatus Methanomethylicia archaeon]